MSLPLPVIFLAPSASITATANRFVVGGSAISLSCSTSGSDVTVTWRAGTSGNAQPEVINTEDTMIAAFGEVENAGPYYCLATNGLGTYVSDPLVLVLAGSVADMSNTSGKSNRECCELVKCSRAFIWL